MAADAAGRLIVAPALRQLIVASAQWDHSCWVLSLMAAVNIIPCAGTVCLHVSYCLTGVSSPLGALLHLLRSPSRALRQQGEEVLRQNYHLRQQEPLEVRPCAALAKQL